MDHETFIAGGADGHIRRGEFNATVGAIQSDVADIKDGQKWNNRLSVTTLLTMLAWAASQIFVNVQGVQVRPTPAYAGEPRALAPHAPPRK